MKLKIRKDAIVVNEDAPIFWNVVNEGMRGNESIALLINKTAKASVSHPESL